MPGERYMMFSRALMVACLSALQWLLWLVSALLVALIVKQYFFGPQAGIAIMQLFWLAAFAAIGGWASGAFSARLRQD